MKKSWFLKTFGAASLEKNSQDVVAFLNKHSLQSGDFKIVSDGRAYEAGFVSVYYLSEQALTD